MTEEDADPARRRTLVLRLVAIAVVIGGVAWMIRDVSFSAIGETIARAELWPIGIAIAINFAIILCKATAWRILLAPAHVVGVGRLYRCTLVAYAASVILPLRAGELVRLWMLRDRDGVPVSRGAAVAVAEKLLDIVAMLLLVAPLPLLVANLPRTTTLWISGLAVAVIALVAVLRALLPRLGTTGWRGELARGLAVLHDPRTIGRALAVLVVGWAMELALVELVLRAVHIDLPLGADLLVLLSINLAIAVPSTPAQLGALELGALIGLHVAGVGKTEGLAFALLFHVLQVVPIVLVGLAIGARELWRPQSR